MQVVKRNGEKEAFNFDKIKKVIESACPSPEHVEQFISDLQIQLKNEMTTEELQDILIQLAVEKTSINEPEWDFVASKLFAYNLLKEGGANRNHKAFGYPDFLSLVKLLVEKGLYHPDMIGKYTEEQIKELGDYIKPERDNLMTYIGIRTLAERYLVSDYNGEILELPQEAFMGVAMFLATAEEPEARVYWAKQFYDAMSELKMTVATPTMNNARRPHNQLSSCFIGTVEDSLENIFHVDTSFSQVSKFGGGMGAYLGKVRATLSDIRGFANTSGGVECSPLVA